MTEQEIADFMEGSEDRINAVITERIRFEKLKKKKKFLVRNMNEPFSAPLSKAIQGTQFDKFWRSSKHGEAFMQLDEKIRLAAFMEVRDFINPSYTYDVFCQIISNRTIIDPIPPWLIEEMMKLRNGQAIPRVLYEDPNKLMGANCTLRQVIFSK